MSSKKNLKNRKTILPLRVLSKKVQGTVIRNVTLINHDVYFNADRHPRNKENQVLA